MSSSLKIDWASHDAAAYACKNWHYSGCMPAGKTIKVGAWEDGRFIGVVIFSRGATPELAKPYKLQQKDVCELTRIALAKHKAPVSRIVSIAIRFLKKKSPGTKLIISFADPAQGHYGGIYQAGNWIYSGTSHQDTELIVGGRQMHRRSANSKWGTCVPGRIEKITGLPCRYVDIPGKHRYLYPLDDAVKLSVKAMAKPYPKRRVK